MANRSIGPVRRFSVPGMLRRGYFGDDSAVPASEGRADETMQDVGDALHYVYDYGDNWELVLRLENSRRRRPTARPR